MRSGNGKYLSKPSRCTTFASSVSVALEAYKMQLSKTHVKTKLGKERVRSMAPTKVLVSTMTRGWPGAANAMF